MRRSCAPRHLYQSCRVAFALTVVPQTQSSARPRHAGAAEDHNKQRAKNFFGWIHSQLPARRENGFREYLKTAKFPQREAKINFFPGKVLLIETAGHLEIASCGKKKRSCAEIEAKIKGAERV